MAAIDVAHVRNNMGGHIGYPLIVSKIYYCVVSGLNKALTIWGIR